MGGGTESMSLIPMGGHKPAPNPSLLERYPDSYLGMGMTAELVAKKYGIDREKSDAFSLASHRKAVAAIEAGRFRDEIAPVELADQSSTVALDEGPRADTSFERLARLKPAFDPSGVVTAGNAPGLSDGAAALVLADADWAADRRTSGDSSSCSRSARGSPTAAGSASMRPRANVALRRTVWS